MRAIKDFLMTVIGIAVVVMIMISIRDNMWSNELPPEIAAKYEAHVRRLHTPPYSQYLDMQKSRPVRESGD
jgi:hypothetical protein